jgi:phage-related protein (TIGR01555 family)
LSKNKRYKNKQYSKESKPTSNPPKKSLMDSFQNALARTGAGTSNIMNATEYPITRISRDYNLLNSLYRNSWIAKKVINTIPEDMCKNWFSLTANLEAEQQDRYDKLERRTKLKEKILEGLTWGRLYGGAAGLMLIDGQEDMLEMPLVPESIMPNTFKGLLILDRWSGIYPSLELIGDINDPDYGLPEFYEIKDTANDSIIQKVHHSRIIRFLGRKLPYYENILEMNWGASELEHVFDELMKRDNTSWNIASLIFQANVLVNKVDGLDQLLALTDQQTQQDFYNVKTAQNQMRNNNAMMIIGDKDDINSLQYTFAGLSDIYNDFMLDISGACDIPVTKLFGRCPAGMNSTGEGDENNYHDMIAQQQNAVLAPIMYQLLPIMFMSEFGYIPNDLGLKFNPTRTPDDDTVARIIQQKVQAIVAPYDAGITNQRISLEELHNLSYTLNIFDSISNEDIKAASTDFIDETNLGEDPNENLNFNKPSVKSSVADGDFKESEHPRKENGQFGSKGGGNSGSNENNSEKSDSNEEKSGIIESIKNKLKDIGIRGEINIPSRDINTDSLSFDDIHINSERNHSVTEAEAKGYIKEAKISITKWNGKFENYYGVNGAVYVNIEDKIIRTCYKSKEFKGEPEKIKGVILKYENGNVSTSKKGD